jgi:hypothetical protein
VIGMGSGKLLQIQNSQPPQLVAGSQSLLLDPSFYLVTQDWSTRAFTTFTATFDEAWTLDSPMLRAIVDATVAQDPNAMQGAQAAWKGKDGVWDMKDAPYGSPVTFTLDGTTTTATFNTYAEVAPTNSAAAYPCQER